jgi:hypothetical protein
MLRAQLSTRPKSGPAVQSPVRQAAESPVMETPASEPGEAAVPKRRPVRRASSGAEAAPEVAGEPVSDAAAPKRKTAVRKPAAKAAPKRRTTAAKAASAGDSAKPRATRRKASTDTSTT